MTSLITLQDLKYINDSIILNNGGIELGISNMEELEQIVLDFKTKTLEDLNKLMFNIIKYRIFKDGNKRTVYIIFNIFPRHFKIKVPNKDIKRYISDIYKGNKTLEDSLRFLMLDIGEG